MDTAKLQNEIYKAMSAEDKWAEVMRLRKFAWELKKAFLKQQNPRWTDQQLESEVRKIFLYAST